MTPTSLKYHLIAELLRLLKAEGTVFGVDQHLKLQALLKSLPDELPAHRLKSILAPAIATNPWEQARFYELFDQAMNQAVEIQAKTQDRTDTDQRAKTDRRLRWLIGILGGGGGSWPADTLWRSLI